LRRRDLIRLREARSTIELLPGVVVTTLAPFCIGVLRYFPAKPLYHLVGCISLQEGTLFIEDLVIWSVRSLPTARRFITRVSHHPIYRLTVALNDLVLIFKEAEILACYS
jgi:hypothetical protein